MDGMGRTVAHGCHRRKAENQHLHLQFLGCPAIGGAGTAA
jgi:hypothetical protein